MRGVDTPPFVLQQAHNIVPCQYESALVTLLTLFTRVTPRPQNEGADTNQPSGECKNWETGKEVTMQKNFLRASEGRWPRICNEHSY